MSHQPTILFPHNKSATSNLPTVLFSQNKPAPAISHQPTEQETCTRAFGNPDAKSSIKATPISSVSCYVSVQNKNTV
jgi:hypothetical protein